MHVTILLLLPLFLLLSKLIYSVVYNLFISPLKAYPGPLLWRISEVPYEWSQLRGNITRDMVKLHERYGPIVRTRPDSIAFSIAETWDDVYGHRKHGQPEFEKAMMQVTVNGVPSILGANRENHGRYRRLLSHAFSAQGMREQEPKINEYVNKLINGLASHCKDGPQDMVCWLNWTTFDLIGDLAFGQSFGCLDKTETHPWVRSVFYNIVSVPYMVLLKKHGLLPLARLLIPKDLQDARLRNFQYASDLIEKRVLLGTDRGDFFDNVLKQDAEKGMDVEEIKTTAGSIVLAGSETTATLLSGLVYYLLNNPEVYEKTVQEIRTSFSSSEDINLDTISRLQYTQAVLTETMRLYPPVPASLDRCVPPGGGIVNGCPLPAGTIVQLFQESVYRLPTNFATPNEMHPERWFTDEKRPKEFDNDNRAVMQPFSYGPRNCIGQNYAYAEMRLITSKLLFRFDLSKPKEGTKERKSFDEWRDTQLVKVLWEKPPLWVDLKERA